MASERIPDISGGELTTPIVNATLVVFNPTLNTDAIDGTTQFIAYQNVGKLPVSDHADAPTTAVTAVRNTHHRITVTTSAVTVTMPSSGLLDGDRVRITNAVQSTTAGSFTTAPGYAVGFANPTSINGAAYTATTTGKWSLWLKGESLLLEWDSSRSTWWVVVDGRLAMSARIRRNSNQTGIVSGASTQVQLDTSVFDTGGLVDTSNNRLQIKRTAIVTLAAATQWSNLTAAAVRCVTAPKQNGNAMGNAEAYGASGGYPAPFLATVINVSSGDNLTLNGFQNSGTNQTIYGAADNSASYLAISELL